MGNCQAFGAGDKNVEVSKMQSHTLAKFRKPAWTIWWAGGNKLQPVFYLIQLPKNVPLVTSEIVHKLQKQTIFETLKIYTPNYQVSRET